jgi:fumarate hydratase class II
VAVDRRSQGLDAGAGSCWPRRSNDKAKAKWDKIIKIGRTHLADATPLRLGQESAVLRGRFGCRSRGPRARTPCWNCRPAARRSAPASTRIRSFGRRVARVLAKETGVAFVEAANHFEANAQRDGLVECHGELRTIATTLFNVANNIRWLGSGPRCGFYEVQLPDRQPGSSIMPGKVNPVMCESMMQVAPGCWATIKRSRSAARPAANFSSTS